MDWWGNSYCDEDRKTSGGCGKNDICLGIKVQDQMDLPVSSLKLFPPESLHGSLTYDVNSYFHKGQTRSGLSDAEKRFIRQMKPNHPVGTSINFPFCERSENSDIPFTMVVYEKIFGSINK